MSTGSAIYEGTLEHRRRRPVEHRFGYRVSMLLADLADLPEALDRHPLWSARRAAPLRLRRADYLERPELPLSEEARELVRLRIGRRPAGPVRLLTVPRFLGIGFNPVSFFYLYGLGGRLEAIIAEVTNTPWGQRHRYVLGAGEDGVVEGRLRKRLHVSPFMPMEQEYEWAAEPPGDRLRVRITSRQRGMPVFDAKLDMTRRPLDRGKMTRALVSHPPQALATLARIYLNAAKLKRKGAPYFPPRTPSGPT